MTRPLTDAQEAYRQSATFGMRKNTLKRAQQITSQRSFIYPETERPRIKCERCGGPRERHAHPICPDCTAKREAGLR